LNGRCKGWWRWRGVCVGIVVKVDLAGDNKRESVWLLE
jgi:hypothetical protein